MACCRCVGCGSGGSWRRLQGDDHDDDWAPNLDLAVLEARETSLRIGFRVPRATSNKSMMQWRQSDPEFFVSVVGGPGGDVYGARQVRLKVSSTGGDVSQLVYQEVPELHPGTEYTVRVESVAAIWRGQRLSASAEARTATSTQPTITEEDWSLCDTGKMDGKMNRKMDGKGGEKKDKDGKDKGGSGGDGSPSGIGAASSSRHHWQGDETSTVVPSELGHIEDIDAVSELGGPAAAAAAAPTTPTVAAEDAEVKIVSLGEDDDEDDDDDDDHVEELPVLAPRDASRTSGHSCTTPFVLPNPNCGGDEECQSTVELGEAGKDELSSEIVIEGDEVERWEPKRFERLSQCNLCTHFLECLKPRSNPSCSTKDQEIIVVDLGTGKLPGAAPTAAAVPTAAAGPTPVGGRRYRAPRAPFPGTPVDPASVGLHHLVEAPPARYPPSARAAAAAAAQAEARTLPGHGPGSCNSPFFSPRLPAGDSEAAWMTV
eukprot:TRINITY_DN4347_c3_g1_i1.p1 TRINITY_DN4347_c3_g1~~TRINITY_DN4347_c3_g1_i1.p1  ORF type:complete len:486 (+),score=107.03 TRINITY_DN4347_c3_g1_i1:168-1625(+)